ncbi:hypothetical protein O7598_24130 [Micromonospora sp. WMMC241]|uniref:hypothetical protein n=1 Tax=Micromonospora sp. WMMC241 TaxID=3015159 RepID=UPI0022B6FAC1|nr:hypothetical protein [Micromonospora sp. WMMC241]MCZ7439513.1 hypothetical protein [Micromonospora sp. WMMC241]
MTTPARHAAALAAPLLLLLTACGEATPPAAPQPVAAEATATPPPAAAAAPTPGAVARLGSATPSRPAAKAATAVARNPGGTVRVVGPGHAYRTPCQAIAAAAAGDTVQIDAKGNSGYAGDVCGWRTDGLMIVGFNGRARVDAAGRNAQGKGTWVIAGDDTVVDNVELSGAKVPDRNGAAIRQEGAGLTVRRSYLHDNENGILAGDNPASDIVVEYTEFARNGHGDGYTHNIYVNHVRSFTLRHSWSHDARVGHLVKSRALVNDILYNRITGQGGTASYEIDLPNGGRSRIVGNVVQQGAKSQNPNLVAYGEEGSLNPDSRLSVVNNTFVNDLGKGAVVLVGGAVSTKVLFQNNVSVGSPTQVSQSGATVVATCSGDPRFVDPAGFDYRLRAGSPCVDAGRTPPAGLAPTAQYRYDLGRQARTVTGGGIDAGAFEQG